MVKTPDKHKNKRPDKFGEQVGEQAKRKLRARQQDKRSTWFGLGMFGLVGWSVAIPTIIGIFIGVWLDRRWPSDVSWTLNFLIIGVILGCFNAWYWIKQESDYD